MIKKTQRGLVASGRDTEVLSGGVINAQEVQHTDAVIAASEIDNHHQDIIPDNEQSLNEATVRKPPEGGRDDNLIIA
jgi:hypothetical protein